MSSVQCLREFVTERLTAAAEEIFGVFEKTIVQYEEEINRQRRLLDMFWKPEVKLHRIELPQQHVRKEEEVLTEQKLDRNSSLDQEDPEPPQIKGEQEELCSSQEVEQLGLKQETDAFMLSPAHEESELREPEPISEHQLVSASSTVAENQDQTGNEQVDSGSTRRRHRKDVDKSFKSKTESKIHTSKKTFKCDICGKDYRSRSGLRIHRRGHTGEKLTFCGTCGKGFYAKSSLNYHMKIHTGDKPHSCDTCGKCFFLKSNLKKHMRTHMDERPFSCEHCEKSFKCDRSLMIHVRSHTGEKPYFCDTCGKSYSDGSVLNRHKRNHIGKSPYSCEHCKKCFRRKADMLVHQQIHFKAATIK